jgi:hypothetical protein
MLQLSTCARGLLLFFPLLRSLEMRPQALEQWQILVQLEANAGVPVSREMLLLLLLLLIMLRRVLLQPIIHHHPPFP